MGPGSPFEPRGAPRSWSPLPGPARDRSARRRGLGDVGTGHRTQLPLGRRGVTVRRSSGLTVRRVGPRLWSVPVLRPLDDADIPTCSPSTPATSQALAPMDEPRLRELQRAGRPLPRGRGGRRVRRLRGHVRSRHGVRLGATTAGSPSGSASDFYYLDRIVLARGLPAARPRRLRVRRGGDASRRRTGGWPCEVNSVPPQRRLAGVPRRPRLPRGRPARRRRPRGRRCWRSRCDAADGVGPRSVRRRDVGRTTRPASGSAWRSSTVAAGRGDPVDDGPRRHGQRARDRPRRVHLHPGRLGVRVRLQLLQPPHRGAGVRHRFLAPTRLGDVLVADGRRAHRFGPRRDLRRHGARAATTWSPSSAAAADEIGGTLCDGRRR